MAQLTERQRENPGTDVKGLQSQLCHLLAPWSGARHCFLYFGIFHLVKNKQTPSGCKTIIGSTIWVDPTRPLYLVFGTLPRT